MIVKNSLGLLRGPSEWVAWRLEKPATLHCDGEAAAFCSRDKSVIAATLVRLLLDAHKSKTERRSLTPSIRNALKGLSTRR